MAKFDVDVSGFKKVVIYTSDVDFGKVELSRSETKDEIILAIKSKGT